MFDRFLPFWILLEKKLAVWATFKINNCQFCHLSGYFQIEYVPCTCEYDLKSFNSNSCHRFPKCNIAALPLEIEVIGCDPIVRGRRNSCRHCAVAWTSTAQLWMKGGGETLHEHGSNSWSFVWCSNMFQLDLWWSLILSHVLFVGSEEWIQFSVFFWSCLGCFNWSSMVISNIEVNGPAFDGWRQSRTDPNTRAFHRVSLRGSVVRSGSWSCCELVTFLSFNLFDLTPVPPKKKSPKRHFQSQTLEGPEMFFLVQLEGVTWFATHDSGLSPANIVALNLFLSDVSFHSSLDMASADQVCLDPCRALQNCKNL